MGQSRKKYLIRAGPQLRLILIFFSVSCLAVLVQAITVHLSLDELLANTHGDEEEIARRVPGLIATGLLRTFLILTPLTLMIGVITTHRLYGPIYRFRTFLNHVRDGTATGPCTIRTRDEFHEVCQAINEATEPLWEQAKEAPEAGQEGGARAA